MEQTLFPVPEEAYGPEYKNHFIEIYRLYVEMADRVSSRRQAANSFYLAVNTAIVGGATFLQISRTLIDGFWLIAIAGVALCAMWVRSIQSYRDLNSAKFQIINKIEHSLPIAPYDAEWELLRRGNESATCRPFHPVEKYIPQIFMALYAIIILLSINWAWILSLFMCLIQESI